MRTVRVVLILLLTFWTLGASAQMTRIRGKVTDAKTGEPIPLASIAVPETSLAVTTDFDGNYFLETRRQVTEIVALYMSYEHQKADVVPGAYNEINFELVPVITDIEEVIIRPSEDPAYEILRKVSRHKKYNDPANQEAYCYSTYTKMELALANMKSEFKGKRMQKNFGFVFEYMDTSALTGRPYLPVMISEATADYYYSRRDPSVSREIVKASRISGIENDQTLAQFTGHLHVDVNVYDNYIKIFEVNFASPLSDHGSLYYKYYLVDSLNINGRKTYKIRFRPRSEANVAFEGEVHIDSLSWAMESVNMRMPRGLNVNWIRELQIENTNQIINDSVWFVKQDKILADFSIELLRDSAKMVSVMGRRQIDYSDIRLGCEIPPEVARLSNDIIISDTVLTSDEEYWQKARPYELSERELGIYAMVDSVKQAPLFRTIYDVINTVIFGHYNIGKVEFGPYYKLFSFNKLEGNRFQLGARTTRGFSDKIRLSGYGAYTTKGNKFKGGGSVEYVFNNMPTSKLTLAAKRDVQQLGASERAISTGNILSSVFARGSNRKLTLINQFDLKFEKEWMQGFMNTFSLQYRQMFPTQYVDFTHFDQEGSRLRRLNTTEFNINTRLSKNEVVVRRTFENIYMNTPYPVIGIDLTAGLKDVLGGDYEYYRTELSLQQMLDISPIGRSNIVLTGGKIFGRVPFPLLKLHEGNATYFYDPMAFSCLNFYEFASDLWGAVFVEHHFRGFFLNRIPLMKKLRWREVLTFKALWGKLSDKNNGALENSRAHLRFPEGMTSVSKPYMEMGVGIENIFRIIRVDAIWRLTHRGSSSDNFSINFSLHLNF